MRTRSHSPAPSGPRLSQIEFETPRRPRPCTRPARRSVRTSLSEAPSLRARLRGEVGDRAGVAERVRRLEVDEVGDRQQRRVEALAREHHRERRLGLDHRVPGPRPSRGRRGSSSASAHRACRPAPGRTARPPRLRASSCAAGDAADAVRDLDELGQLRDPRRDRDLLALELARPAAPVPLLVRRRRARRGPRRAARAARPARAPSRRGCPSCRPSRGDRRRRTRARRGSGAAAGCPDPSSRMLAAAVRTLRSSWSYLPAFTAMSSPNHFACSCASAWQPTLTSRAV